MTKKEYNHQYYLEHREKYITKAIVWQQENPISAQRTHWANDIKRKYGIIPEDWARLYEKQGGHCALCLETSDLQVDHDHATREVRGLLCHTHNRAIGLLGDNEKGLVSALEYLRNPPYRSLGSGNKEISEGSAGRMDGSEGGKGWDQRPMYLRQYLWADAPV